MKVCEIKDKAKQLGVKVSKKSKVELIQAVQVAENNTPCFGKSNGQCWRSECCFISDCLKTRL